MSLDSVATAASLTWLDSRSPTHGGYSCSCAEWRKEVRMLADLDRARNAVEVCNPTCDRDEWRRLAMASNAPGLDLGTVAARSAQGRATASATCAAGGIPYAVTTACGGVQAESNCARQETA